MCTRRVVYGLAKFAVILLLQCQLERFLELFLSWCWWSLESAVCFSVLRECSFCRFMVLCIVYLRTLCIRLSLLLFLHDVAFHWRAITPSWLVGWMNGCVCLCCRCFRLAGMRSFGSPLFFNGETKIILGGCWITRTGIGEMGGILDGRL
jgi:hypothetical protein